MIPRSLLVAVVCAVVLIQLVHTFAPPLGFARSPVRLGAASDDIPDIVKAYKKAKPVVEASIPDTTTSIPAVPETPPAAVPDTSSISKPLADIKDSLSDIKVPDLPEAPSMEALKDAAAAQTSSVNEFLQAAKAGYQVKSASLSNVVEQFNAMKPATTPRTTTDLPTLSQFIKNNGIGIQKSQVTEFTATGAEGKAPTLGEFFQQRVAGGLSSTGSGGASPESAEIVANAKAKFALMLSNTYHLFGVEGPEGLQEKVKGMGGELSTAGVPSMEQLPPGAAGWSVAAFAFLIAANQRQAGVSDVRGQMENMVEKEALAVSELAEQVKSMGAEIKKLNDQTNSLRKELEDAKAKLTKKELEISKERLKVADKELVANRKIEQLETKLRQSDNQIKSLESELKDTRSVRNSLSGALDKAKDLETELKAAGSVEVVEEIKEALEPPAPKAKKAAAKKKATKGEKAAVKTVRVTKGTTAKKEAAPKAAKAKKAAKKKAVKVAVSATKEWKELSQSTLKRKTVKELTEYLEEKGVATTDGDGKPLKKAVLVDAVLSM